ncbi:MAG: hypothetical protein AAGF59_00745 [Pseudomonadota bacterium]
MSILLQQTTQTVSSLSVTAGALPFGSPPGADNGETNGVKASPTSVLEAAAKAAEEAAVVIDALQRAADQLRGRDPLSGVAEYQRLGEARQDRPETRSAPAGRTDLEFEAQRIRETTIQGEGFSASLIGTQSVSVGPEGRFAEIASFGEASFEVDGFEVSISFNQVAEFDEAEGSAFAERFGTITIEGEDFEATFGFEQALEFGPDGVSVSSGRFAEFAVEGGSASAEYAIEAVAGFNPSGIFVSLEESRSLAAETESGAATIEILKQLDAYAKRNDSSPNLAPGTVA